MFKLIRADRLHRSGLLLIVVGPAGAMAAGYAPSNYVSTFSDEFTGTSLDTTKWDYRNGSASNTVSVSGGTLGISVYTSSGTNIGGEISTEQSFLQTYGYYECSMTAPATAGAFPAFWVQSPTVSTVGNPPLYGVETDIAEIGLYKGTGDNALHWDGYATGVTQSSTNDFTATSGAHTYGVLWTPAGYTFYVDGKQVWQTSDAVSQRSEYIILDNAVNQYTAGTPPTNGYGTISSTTTVAKWDYVHAYSQPTYNFTPTSGSSLNWSAGTNWDVTPVSAQGLTMLTFGPASIAAGTSTTTNDIGSGEFGMNILNLNGTGPSSGAATINIASASGHSLGIGVGSVTINTGTASLPSVVNLNANTSGSGSLTYNVTSSLRLINSTTFQGDGSATFNFSGTLSGAGTLTKTRSSTLTLSGSNSYYGGTTIADGGGALVISNVNALGMGSVTIAKNSTDSGELGLNFAGTGTNTISNTFAGFTSANSFANGGFATIENIAGNNKLTSAMSITVTGGNGINVQSDPGVGNSLELAGGISATQTYRVLALGGDGNGVVSGAISNGTGGMSVEKDGAGTWVLTGANTYSGLSTATAINAGTLQIGNGGTTGSLGSYAVSNAGVLAFNRSDSVAVANAISGTGSLVQSGTGTTRLTGTSTYTGTTAVTAGTLTVDATTNTGASIAGSGTISVAAGSTFRLLNTAATGATSMIATTSTVAVVMGSQIELDLNKQTQSIGVFTINGVAQPVGRYGSAQYFADIGLTGSQLSTQQTTDEAYFVSSDGGFNVVPEPASGGGGVSGGWFGGAAASPALVSRLCETATRPGSSGPSDCRPDVADHIVIRIWIDLCVEQTTCSRLRVPRSGTPGRASFGWFSTACGGPDRVTRIWGARDSHTICITREVGR